MKGTSSSNQLRPKAFRAQLKKIARNINNEIVANKTRHMLQYNVPNQRQRRKLARQTA